MANNNTYNFDAIDFDSLSEKDQIEIVRENPNLIKFFHHPKRKVQMAAIDADPHSIKFIDDEDRDSAVQIHALEKDESALKDIKRLTVLALLAYIGMYRKGLIIP